MKIRNIGLILFSLFFVLSSCSETSDEFGKSLLLTEDEITSYTETYYATTRSVLVDSVYAKSGIGYVGRFSDPIFGYYESSFISELYCPEDFEFPAVYKYDAATQTGSGTVAGDSIVSARLVLYYGDYFGDSLNACRMSIYKLNDKWREDRKSVNRFYRYTSVDLSQYYDEDDLIGRKAYTAYDTSIPDSIRNDDDYYPYISFDLDRDYWQNVLEMSRQHPEYFADADAFIENVFPGVYVKSDYGDGTVLYIENITLQVTMRFHYVDSLGVALKKSVTDDYGKAGEDSLYYGVKNLFGSTKEVIQNNHFTNSSVLAERAAETEHTYLKTPAGIYTAIKLPYDEIGQILESDTLNSVKLALYNYHQDTGDTYSMSAPSTVLLIRKKDVKSFFENNELPDSQTTYTTGHNSVGTNEYTFSNIARLVTTCVNEKKAAKKAAGTWTDAMNEAWEDENELYLIPVSFTTVSVSSGSSYYSYYYGTSSTSTVNVGVSHDLSPSYAMLVGGDTPIEIEVIYSVHGGK